MILSSFFKKIIIAINNIVPKDKRVIIFHSFPDVSDNSLALYEYIAKHQPGFISTHKIVWLVDDDRLEKYKDVLKNRTGVNDLLLYKRLSLKGLWTLFRCSVIVSTHGCFSSLTTKNQVNFNLWHGMPFKKIGYLLRPDEFDNNIKADITFATSLTFRKIMAECFNITQENVFVTGLPRNDYLLTNNNILSKFGIEKKSNTKIFVWLPTYRKSVIGDIRLDGVTNTFGIKEVFDAYFDKLDQLLKEKDIILIIKPHPMDELAKADFKTSNNILFIRNEMLSNKNVQLYELLASSDVLITDYSSVFIDYLVTGKPMAFVISDFNEYSKTRGFIFDPPLEFLPGEIISNNDELFQYIENYKEKNDKWNTKYKSVKEKFNICNGSHASEQVFKILNDILN